MRVAFILLATSALAACSGGGPTTVSGSAAVVTGAGQGGSGGLTTTTSDPFAEFSNPVRTKTYNGIGGTQVYEYTTDDRDCCNQQAQQFAGRNSTPRDQVIQVTYDPKAGVFTLVSKDALTGANAQTRFQDPASRTNFGGAIEPQWGVQQLANSNIRYVEAGDGDPLSPYQASGTGAVDRGTNTVSPIGNKDSTYQSTTFFYEVPGSNTKYVSLAGYVRNSLAWKDVETDFGIIRQTTWHLERSGFAFGALTDVADVPKTGSATFNGNMVASVVFNPTLDGNYGAQLPTYYQWLEGTARTTVNFAANTVNLALNGTVYKAFYDRNTGPQAVSLNPGTTFTATGSGAIDLVRNGGFFGQFSAAAFGTTNNGSPGTLNLAGSSFDGAFYGPKANEVGGGFHISGATPDERIDIVGGFTGK
jgi:C-lobe and N-lobe beta barrels of Tf-binding protein B